MPVRNKLFDSLEKVQFTWDVSPIYVIEEHAKALAWTPKTRLPFLVSSKVGRGRLVIIASWNFTMRNNFEEKYRELFQRLVKWLSRGQHEDASRCSNLQHSRQELLNRDLSGTFYLWQHDPNPLREEEVQALMEAILEGRINLVLALDSVGRFGGSLSPLVRMAGVRIPHLVDYTSYGEDVEVETDQLLNNPVLSVKEALIKTFKDGNGSEKKFQDFLLNQGCHVLGALGMMEHEEARRLLRATLDKEEVLLEWIYRELPRIEALTPTPARALQMKGDPMKQAWCHRYNLLLLCSPLLVDSGLRAPFVEEYPGDVAMPVKLQSALVTVTARTSDEFHPLGFYLPAGSTMEVTVLEPGLLIDCCKGFNEQWILEVGCWTDVPSNHETWRRFPIMRTVQPLLHNDTYKVHSPFGGNIIIRNGQLKCDDHKRGVSLTVLLKGVVESPYLNLRDPATLLDWEDRKRRAPGPWADLVGDAISFCIPSRYVRNYSVDEMVFMLRNVWDHVVKSDKDLVGKHLIPGNKQPPRRERVVLDTAPTIGYAHSGHPIVAQEDDNFGHSIVKREHGFNAEGEGAWGLCHEIGHRMQENTFTWGETREVTVNIFTLYNRHRVFHLPIFEGHCRDRIGEAARKYLQHPDGVDYSRWRDDACALTIYAQLAFHLGFGVIREWLHSYRTQRMTDEDCRDPQTVRDQWALRVSLAAKCNVVPLFDFWAIPVTEDIRQREDLRQLPPFLPWDWVVEFNVMRCHMIRHHHGITNEDAWRDIVRDVRSLPCSNIPDSNLNDLQENDIEIQLLED